MLSPGEEDFLSKIPGDKIVTVKPYDEKIAWVAEEIIGKIKRALPELEVRFMGASALGISGQGDIDIYIFSSPEDFDKHLSELEEIFGPKVPSISIIKWAFLKEGHEVEIYLTDPTSEAMKKQIKIFEILQKDVALRDGYERLKESMSGKPFGEYQRKKYEFYHRILDDK